MYLQFTCKLLQPGDSLDLQLPTSCFSSSSNSDRSSFTVWNYHGQFDTITTPFVVENLEFGFVGLLHIGLIVEERGDDAIAILSKNELKLFQRRKVHFKSSSVEKCF